MKNLLYKFIAVMIVWTLTQACSQENISPREISDPATRMTAVNKKINNAFTVNVRPWNLEFAYGEITFDGAELGKTLTVDWGDGTVETYTFNRGFLGKPEIRMEHYYTIIQEFVIVFSGDLDNVIGVNDPFNSLETLSINFDKLTRLERVHMPYNSFEIVDVSKNHRLKHFYGPSSTLTMAVILPKTHELSFVSSGSPNLPTEIVSDMIASVYKNAVAKKIYNGQFELASMMVEDPIFPGPPTEQDIAKLAELRDLYGWTIFPNP
jgi:hypothetical protein